MQGQQTQAGAQMPGKYPRVGPNYMQYGEQPGLIYDYARDAYFPDPKVYQEQYGEYLPQEPEQPGLLETLGPVAGTMAAIEGGKAIGPKIVEGVGGLFDGSGGLFGGEATKPVAETVATEGGGLFGLGGGGGSELAQIGTNIDGSPIMGEAASAGAEGGLFSNGSLGSFAQTAAPIAAIAYGANAAKDFAEDGDLSTTQKLALALPTAGLSFAAKPIAKALGIGQPSTKEIQREGWSELGGLFEPTSPTAQYIADYQKHIENPNWGPEGPKKFEDMVGIDLTPGKAFFDAAGQVWLEDLSEQERINVAQAAKDKGYIYSKKGDIRSDSPESILQLIEEEKAKRNQEGV